MARWTITHLGDGRAPRMVEAESVEDLAGIVSNVSGSKAELIPIAAGWLLIWGRGQVQNTGAYFVERARA